MKKVAFHNLGCKVNSYEMDGIMQMFQRSGYKIVDFAQKADIYVVNTCTVTNIADRKSRQMLHKAKSENPNAIVVATGCYVQTDKEGAVKDEAIDLAVGNNEKAKLLEYVEELIRIRESNANEAEKSCDDRSSDKTLGGKTIDNLEKETEYENMNISHTAEHTRAYIKIQDGCNQFCSYCAIPLARGRVRSRRPEDIVREVHSLADNGYCEVVLTGIHLSSYGLDNSYNSFIKGESTNEALLSVIAAVADIEGIRRIRLGSLEPGLITDDFMSNLVKIDKVCPHFHLSLQSGSDTVLARMNRQYDSDEYAMRVNLIRKYYEHPAITTDIIVGFPGETEEEFDDTRRFAEKVDLYETHVFKYSRRKGTAADKMPGQHTDKVKSERSRILMGEAAVRTEKYMSYYIGKRVSVLAEDIEEIEGKKYMVGYTPQYVKCAIPCDVTPGTIYEGTGAEISGERTKSCVLILNAIQ